MRKAVDANFNIVVHIHLDDGLDKGTWRNVMIFNPIAKYGGVTYYDTVVKPTAEAVKLANYKGKPVYFAMQVCAAKKNLLSQPYGCVTHIHSSTSAVTAVSVSCAAWEGRLNVSLPSQPAPRSISSFT
jgi:hypothetical protein